MSEAVITGTWGIGTAVAYSPNFYKGIAAAVDVFNMFDRIPHIRDSNNSSTQPWVIHSTYMHSTKKIEHICFT